MDKEQWIYFAPCEEIECPDLCDDGCRLGTDPQDCLLLGDEEIIPVAFDVDPTSEMGIEGFIEGTVLLPKHLASCLINANRRTK